MSRATTVAGLTALALAATVIVATPPVWAQSNRDKVLSIVSEAAKATGAKSVAWGSVTGDDARFTVADGRATLVSGTETTEVKVAATTYTNAVPTADGGYTADEIALDKVLVSSPDTKISIEKIALSRYVGRAPARILDKTTEGERFEKIVASGIVVTSPDGKQVPVASVAMDARDWVAGAPRQSAVEIKGIIVPLDPKDPDLKDFIALGYKQISLDFAGAGSWDEKSGRLLVDRFDLGGADVGTLKIGFALGGITPQFVQAVEAAKGDDAKQMELLQAVTVESATLRWIDASLATRLIAQQASEQGVDAKAYAKQLKLMLPMVLSMVGDKDFEKKVAGAAGAFLDAPKSLTVTAKPAKPLPVSQIVGAAMMAPQSLPKVLGADVRAND
jgi:hypothetical protein